ncbi:MAG TPA: response regulator transcription factor [Pilimelia sp.]|nr:response regulator transcription factor [Pilimelia sp.]
MIRILLGHQSNLVSSALATVLGQEDDLTVVGECGDAEGILAFARREKPDVAVLDHAVGGDLPVVDLCHRLTEAVPGVHALILLDRSICQRLGPDLVRLAPAVGLLDTSSSPGELIRCVRRLMQGQPVLDVHFAVAALKADRNPLTDREREVLRRAVHGEPIADIAANLYLSTGTVRNYLSRITAKTGGRTRIEAIRIAEDAGWI